MAKRASYGLFCLFLSILFCSSSGTLVGFSHHARGSTKAMQVLNQYNLATSQLRVFVSDHESLSSLSKTGLSLDLYLNKNQLDTLTKPKPSSLSWLKTRVNIKTLVATIGNDGDRTGLNDLTRLLPTLKSVHSIILTSFGNNRKDQVKVSVALPLSLFSNMSLKHERDLCRVFSYIKEVKSFPIIEATINGDKSLQTVIQKASILPCVNDILIVLTVKTDPAITNPEEMSEFTHRLSELATAQNKNKPRSANIAGFYVELGPVLAKELVPSTHRELLSDQTTQYDTIFPTAPIVSNTPITPTIVTVNPSPVTVTNPAAPVVTLPATAPPVAPIAVPGGQPIITNPATTYTTPVAPPASYVAGQTWCVAKTGAAEAALQAALDYACGVGADCAQIQQGGSCFNPNTLQSHASFAFNSYFQKNPLPTSCDFGGTAAMINANPSTGYCTYPASASSSSPPIPASPQTTTPIIPTPVAPIIPTPVAPVTPTPSVPTPTLPSVPTPTPIITNPTTVPTPAWSTVPGSGNAPPTLLNTSSGAGPEFGLDGPPGYSNSSASKAIGSIQFRGFILLLTYLVLRKAVLV